MKIGLFSEKKASTLIGVGVLIMVLTSILFIIKGSWVFNAHNDIDEVKMASYGDFIAGTVGTLFSLVGIILFYIALKEQRKDIKTNEKALKTQVEAFKQQVKEFELQRAELAETRKVYEEQSKTLRAQKFEETFYSYMNVFIEKRKDLPNGNYNEFFREKAKELNIKDLAPGYAGLLQIEEAYESLYVKNRSQLSSYFIIFYRLLKLIEMSDIGEKEIYHKILRSVISKDELLILYYNYHSKFGQKPIPIALKYGYFKHLEKLSKIELKTLLFEKDNVFALNSLVDTLSEEIIRCVEKAKSLEEEEDIIVEFEIATGAFIRIEIINGLHVQIITNMDLEELFDRPLNEFYSLFEHLLIDIIYSSYFVVFNEGFLKRVTTNDRNQKIESFNFSNINHL